MSAAPEISSSYRQIFDRAREFLLNPPPETDPQDLGRTYGYFLRHPVAPLNRRRLEAIVKLMAQQKSKPSRILDIACGGGLITTALAMAFSSARTLGVDLNPTEIQLAQSFAKTVGSSAQFLQLDVLSSDAWFSTCEQKLGGPPSDIVCAYALHHLPQVDRFLDVLAKKLPAGARVIVNEENPHSPLFRLKHWVRGRIQKDTDTEWHQPLATWRRAFEQRGFSCAPAQGLDLVPGLGKVAVNVCWSVVFIAQK